MSLLPLQLLLLLSASSRSDAGNISRSATRWNNACISVDIAPELESRRSEFQAAVDELNGKTDACFQLIDWRTVPAGEDWMYFVQSRGCSSFVGKQTNCAYQEINIAPGCQFVEILHETMHALGAYHEHQRPDRDSIFSEINRQASSLTDAQWRVNFGIPSDAEAVGSYDLASVMHYRTTAFSVDGTQETLVPIQESWRQAINRRKFGLTVGDIQTVNKLVEGKGGRPRPDPVEPTCAPRLAAAMDNNTIPIYF